MPFLSIGMSMVSLFVATFAVGPVVRVLYGAPPGFGEDFTSTLGSAQALGAEVITLSFGFLLFGMLLGSGTPRIRFEQALWAANPITVGIGFLLFKTSYQLIEPVPFVVEDILIRNGFWLGIFSPIFAYCIKLGGLLVSRVK